MSLSCHFRDCKSLPVTSLNRLSNLIESTWGVYMMALLTAQRTAIFYVCHQLFSENKVCNVLATNAVLCNKLLCTL